MGIIANVPWALSMFLSLVLPFLDPITREKIIVATSSDQGQQLIHGAIPVDELQSDYGGTQHVSWDARVHDAYWPVLRDICIKRRAYRLKKWNELGAKVGISEDEWKGMSEDE